MQTAKITIPILFIFYILVNHSFAGKRPVTIFSLVVTGVFTPTVN